MARSKEFDYDQALDAALQVFWEKGYEATSVQDLVDATGVNRASLYQTFGNKDELFRKVLARFGESSQDVRCATASVEPGMARIRAALRSAGEQAAGDTRGCLMVNAIVELACRDEEMKKHATKVQADMERFFVAELKEAERRGEIRPGQNHLALGRFLTNVIFGMRVTAKTGASGTAIREIVEVTLGAIEKS